MEKSNRRDRIREYKERKLTGGVLKITNQQTGRYLLLGETNLQGSKNRFAFSVATNTCIHAKLREDWNRYGPESFSIEILEEIEQKDGQTADQFREDIQILTDLWREKESPSLSY